MYMKRCMCESDQLVSHSQTLVESGYARLLTGGKHSFEHMFVQIIGEYCIYGSQT